MLSCFIYIVRYEKISFILWLNSILLCRCVEFSWSVSHSMCTLVLHLFWVIENNGIITTVQMFSVHWFNFLWIYAQWWDWWIWYMVIQYLSFRGTSILFYKMNTSVRFAISSVPQLFLFYILIDAFNFLPLNLYFPIIILNIFFIYVLAIGMSSFEKRLFETFTIAVRH